MFGHRRVWLEGMDSPRGTDAPAEEDAKHPDVRADVEPELSGPNDVEHQVGDAFFVVPEKIEVAKDSFFKREVQGAAVAEPGPTIERAAAHGDHRAVPKTWRGDQ